MPANFGLTMAPETAYVTGGSVTYGSIWGAYLPIVKKYADNGRLWWLNMQYYNGSMYGCSGDSYSGRHRPGLHRADRLPEQRPGHPGHHHQGPVRQAGPRPARAARRRAAATWRRAWSRRPGTPTAAALKGLMTWSVNWDGSKGWTFGDNVKALQGR